MLFNSFPFLLLFLPVIVAAWHFSTRLNRPWLPGVVLATGSVIFYAIWNPPLLLLLIGSIVVNYAIGAALGTTGRRGILLGAGITANVVLLGVFKYAGFFADTFSGLSGIDWAVTGIALPLAISFFTFQQIAFLVDTYRGFVRENSLRRYFLFVSFFPQLIAGPIVRHDQVASQLGRNLSTGLTARNLAVGLTIIAFGLGKKVILADGIAGFVDPFYEEVASGYDPQFIESWLIAIGYSFQIYFDFSGYSDIAVGLATLFGIRLPVNFMNPYRSTNLIGFWRNWHITLSSFLRDYVYIPLGGNRRSLPRWYVNMFVVMLIGGLWHGAAWTFVVWGGLHGVGLSATHFLRKSGFGMAAPWIIGWLTTFVFVTVLWVFFRADSFDTAGRILGAMAGIGGAFGTLSPSGILNDLDQMKFFGEWIVLVVGLAGFFALIFPDTYQIMGRNYGLNPDGRSAKFAKWKINWRASMKYGVAVSALLVIGLAQLLLRGDSNQFIYFEF
ncbi:MAG: MBOAT family protein [Chloroflexi bacterium]|nr:MBOAT family protein [Chloroflexota bacterium]